MANSVSIIFNTNAATIAKSIAEMTAEIDKLKSRSRRSQTSTMQTRETLTGAFRAANRPDLSRQSGLNAVRGATQKGLTDRLEASTVLAANMLKRTKGAQKLVAELNEGVGYAIDEGMRPLREAATALRKKASKTKDKKKQAELMDAADEIDKQVGQYDRLRPGQKAARRAFKEADSLTALEKAQTAFQKIGVEMGSAGDLSKFAGRLTTISPAIAHSVQSLRDSMNRISPQDYMARLAEISQRGVATLTGQRDAFTAQINKEVTGRAGKGGGYRHVFEKRFGDVEAMMASGKQFEFKDIADQTAFSAWKDSVRKGLGGYITKQLDPKSIKQLTQLNEAKKGGDEAQIQAALAKAERAVKTRLSTMYEQLAKLEDIAKTTKDRDLNNIVNGFKRQLGAQAQVLNSQVADGALKTQGALYSSLEAGLKNFNTTARTLGGSKTTKTKDNLGQFVNDLDEAAFQLISDQVTGFKRLKFKSLGNKNLEQAGFSPTDQNVLTSKILAPAGFFKAGSQEERLDALGKATQLVTPTLEAMGLKGKDLITAQTHLKNVIDALSKQYGKAANFTQGVNAEQAQLKRAKALELVSQGKFDEARKMVDELDGLVSTRVNRGRPSKRKGGGVGGGQARSQAELDSQAILDREENKAQVEAAINRAQNNPKNSFMGKLRTVSAFAGSLLNVYGLVASAVGTVVNLTTQLIQKANELDKVASTVNALGGSFSSFSEAMKVATTQQALYGGTLTETMQGLTSLMPITKRYGVDLAQLDNVARRLAVVDPLQGFAGASIALKEFFSGDITSLSRRFEIDRKSLNSIKAAGTQAEQLVALDKALAGMGISTDVLAAKTQTAAVKFDRAGASWENFQTVVGKSLQSTFAPAADAVSELFSESGVDLANIVEMEQYLIDIQKQMSRTAAQFKDFGEELEPVATELDRFTSGALFDEASLTTQKADVTALINQFNDLINKLNEIRDTEGKTRIQLFSEKDAELIKQLAVISEQTGISVKVLLEERSAGGRLKTNKESYNEQMQNIGLSDSILFYLTAGLGQTEEVQNMRNLVGNVSIGNVVPKGFDNTVVNPADFGGTDSYEVKQVAFDKATAEAGLRKSISTQNLENASAAYTQAAVESSKQISNLPDLTKTLQIENLKNQENIDYTKSMEALRNKLTSGVLTQEESDAVLRQMIELNKKLLSARAASLQVEDSYISNMAKSVQAFGSVTAKDSIVKRLDEITQKQAESGQGFLSRLYGMAGGGATLDPNNKGVKEIVKFAKEKFNIDRETLYYTDQLEKKQAKMALNANKTVSAYNALTNLASGLNVSLNQAVQYAMEFSSQVSGFASSSVFGQLSLQDRLNISSISLDNIGAPGGPQNSGEATAALSNYTGLLLEQANAGKASADATKKITEKYEKDKVKIQKEGEDERTKIMEDWSETTARLIRESEYAKRAQTADFYETMFQNDNLTAEQQAGFSARREAIREEADLVRSEDPAKAQLIMDAGEQQIKNEMEAAEKIAKYQKDNVEIDEELGELQSDLAKAKDEEARKDIRKKIEKLNQQKLENQREIDQVIAVQRLRAIADEQKLKDARNGISEEQRARDKAIQDSKDKEAKALGEIKTQRDADLAEEITNRSKATQAQIADAQDYQRVVSIGNIMQAAAAMAASGKSQEEVKSYIDTNLGDITKYFADKGTPFGKGMVKYIEGQKNLVGSTATGVNPALAALAEMFGIPLNGGLPEMDIPITTFNPYTGRTDNGPIRDPDNPGFNTPGGPGQGPQKPVNLPKSLELNAVATTTNTERLIDVNTSLKTLNDNLWYMMGRRGV